MEVEIVTFVVNMFKLNKLVPGFWYMYPPSMGSFVAARDLFKPKANFFFIKCFTGNFEKKLSRGGEIKIKIKQEMV